MIGHLILISAQVQSKAGVPVLEGITFGVFSRIQGGAAGLFRSMAGTWSELLRAARRPGRERGAAPAGRRPRSPPSGAAGAGLTSRAAAGDARPPREHDASDAGGRSDRRQPQSRADDGDRQPRQRGRRPGRHGGDRAEGRGRPRRRARWPRTRRACSSSSTATPPWARSASARGPEGWPSASTATRRSAWSSSRTWPTSRPATSSSRRASTASIPRDSPSARWRSPSAARASTA